MIMNERTENLLVTATWETMSSHPASRTAYQATEIEGVVYARVAVDGHEVVSPSDDYDHVYRQYDGRVRRAIEELEQPLYGVAADQVRDALRNM